MNDSHMAPTKRKKDDDEYDSDSDTEDQGPKPWPRFLTMKSKTGIPITKTNPFAIGKALKDATGKKIVAKKLQTELLIEAADAKQASQLRAIRKVGQIEVVVEPHRTLNTSRGVIRDEALSNMSEEDLVESLRGEGVTGVRFFTGDRNGHPFRHPTVVLTFNTPTPPKQIWAGFYWLKVRDFIPNPLRCFKCQRYGHTEARCRQQVACFRCGGEHAGEGCKEPPKCVNCSEGHPSSSKQCGMFKHEQEIQKIKVQQKVSFPEARRLAGSPAFRKDGVSYADKLRPKMTKSTGTSPCPQYPLDVFVPFTRFPSPVSGARLGQEALGTTSDLPGSGRGRPLASPVSDLLNVFPPQASPLPPLATQTAAPSQAPSMETQGSMQGGIGRGQVLSRQLQQLPGSQRETSSQGTGPKDPPNKVKPKVPAKPVKPTVPPKPPSKDKPKQRSASESRKDKRPIGPENKPRKGDDAITTQNRFSGLESMETGPSLSDSEFPPSPSKKS